MPEKARTILNYITDYKTRRGIAPTYREIGASCGVPSTSLVRYYLDMLEVGGHVVRLKGVSRGILLAEEASARGLGVGSLGVGSL